MECWGMTFEQYLETPETVIADMIFVMAAEAEVAEEMRHEQDRKG